MNIHSRHIFYTSFSIFIILAVISLFGAIISGFGFESKVSMELLGSLTALAQFVAIASGLYIWTNGTRKE